MLSQPLLLVSFGKNYFTLMYLQVFSSLNTIHFLVKVKEAAVEIPTPNTSGGVYIPPTSRLQAAGGSSSSASSKSRTCL
jgi:hypothetical protein